MATELNGFGAVLRAPQYRGFTENSTISFVHVQRIYTQILQLHDFPNINEKYFYALHCLLDFDST